jgi:IPT/TIG domain
MRVMRTSLALALILSAAAAFATPVITSVTPSSGPVTGGTQVTIKGSGFSDVCAPPKACPVKSLNVYFSTDIAASSTIIDTQTIIAVTASHLPETATVTVCQLDGCISLSNAFTFIGDPGDAFDRILLPIFLAPTQGAFRSVFVTSFEMWNKVDGPEVAVYGIPYICPPITCVPPDPRTPYMLIHDTNATVIQPSGGTPGHILFVAKERASAVAATLRVYDESRVSTTLGTEIPVVHDRDFHSDTIALLGVPLDSRFRNTLRIYSATPAATDVKVTIGDATSVVHLAPGVDLFQPSSATFTTFPPPLSGGSDAGVVTRRVTIEPLVAGTRIWAFISVTNNETQQITVISPQ